MSPTNIKLLSFSIILIIAALFFGYALLLFNRALSLNFLILLLAAVILFLSFFILQALFIKKLSIQAGLCLAESAAIILPFYKEISLMLIAASAFLFLILLGAARSGRKELRNFLKIDLFAIGKSVTAKASIAVIVFGVVAYLGSVTFQDIVNTFLKSGQPIIQSIVNQFSPLVSQELSAQAENLILTKLAELPENIKKLTVVGFALLIFFSVRAVFFLINWAAVLVSFVLYRILLSTRFITISLESKTKETLKL